MDLNLHKITGIQFMILMGEPGRSVIMSTACVRLFSMHISLVYNSSGFSSREASPHVLYSERNMGLIGAMLERKETGNHGS